MWMQIADNNVVDFAKVQRISFVDLADDNSYIKLWMLEGEIFDIKCSENEFKLLSDWLMNLDNV